MRTASLPASRPGRSARAVVARRAAAACVLLVAIVGVGCSSDPPTIEVSNARMAVPANEQAAVYLTLHNPGEQSDELVSAYSSASPMIHLHQSQVSADGTASMSKVKPLVVKPGGTIRLSPGGDHLMMMYPEPVKAGDEVSLTLNFERAGNVKTTVEVLDVVEPDAP